MDQVFHNYQQSGHFDELLTKQGKSRPAAKAVFAHFEALGIHALHQRQEAANAAIRAMGISFTVNSEAGNIDRNWPFDVVPRTMAASEWHRIEDGLRQRLQALNCFIDDVYNEQRIVTDGIFPREVLEGSKNFRAACQGIHPPHKVWANICGSDLVRDADGTVYVLEDNLRVPSGVSYMLENREIMKRLFPELFAMCSILPVDDYPSQLFSMLSDVSPRPGDQPVVAVLTPGIYNSAYFEHSYLAQQMGVYLAEGSDFVVDDEDQVFLRTIAGLLPVDVIYRRVDDDFLDPEVFREDSVVGVSGLMRSWRRGKVAIANAPGTGVADDKVVYAFVPDFIRYYLDAEPILPNVPTYLCMRDADREYVRTHLAQLVVKPANESGGYGMLIGPRSTAQERERFAELIEKDPRNYIAQPTLALSTAPTLVGDRLEARHVDLRPFILQAKDTYVTTGGLTRVAMNAGSLVVNSSQGGGSKDTWIVEEDPACFPA